MFTKPKGFTNKFYIYCSEYVLSRCDLKNEAKSLIESGKIKNKDQLYIHMGLITNFLLNTIDDQVITNVSRKDLQKVSTTKMYRTCIDILKKHKLLFICGSSQKESYLKGAYSKGYKFNFNMSHLASDKPLRIEVKDHRLKKKVIDRIDLLQINRSMIEKFTKRKALVNMYSKKARLRKPKLIDIFNNNGIYDNSLECEIYAPLSGIKKRENNFKMYLLKKIQATTPFIVKFSDISKISISQISKLTTYLYEFWMEHREIRWANHLIRNDINELIREYGVSDIDTDIAFIARKT